MRGAPVSLTASTPATVTKLTIREALERKKDLEAEIEASLFSFTEQTGLNVVSIDIDSILGFGIPTRYCAQAEVKL